MPSAAQEGAPFRLAEQPTQIELLAKYFRAVDCCRVIEADED